MRKRVKAVGILILVLAVGWISPGGSGVRAEGSVPEELSTLYARSAVLMDADSGRILYGKDSQQRLPMASTTKIMTCILALEKGDLEQKVTASQNAASQPKVRLGVASGEEFYLKDLLYSLMLESHNDAAVAIAEAVGGSVEGFAGLMNEKAEEIGCKDTYFITPNGLDAQDEKGIHSTTAEDLARIMRYCIMESPCKDSFLEITRTMSYVFSNAEGSRSFSCVNHNAFLGMMEGALSGKTGFTNNAGYCYVGALKKDQKTFIVALLACGWPNHKTYKWSDTKKLMSYGLEHYDYRNIYKEIDLAPIPVLNGIPGSGVPGDPSVVELYAEDGEAKEKRFLLRGDESVSVTSRVRTSLEAPVEAGTQVGTVCYLLNGQVLMEYPIKTKTKVDSIGYEWCLRYILERFMGR